MPLKLKPLHPEVGYRNNNLWLPLKYIENLEGVKNTLTFPQEQSAAICSWEETDTHLVTPREFIEYENWKDLPFKIVESSWTDFPEIRVRRRTEPRGPIQRLAFTKLLEKGSGILSLACGRGKTCVSLHAWTELGMPALVVVHTKDLLHQWQDRIVEHTTVKEDDIGVIQGDKMDWEHPISVAMIHTLAARSESFEYPVEAEHHFGVVIYDEVHHLGAPFFNAASSVGHGLRWGLTATWQREDGMDDLYTYHLGDVLYENLEQDVIPEVFFVRTNVEVNEKQLKKLMVRDEVNFAKLCKFLAGHPGRNQQILETIDDCLDEGRKILFLSNLVDHLKFMHSHYPESGLIHGKVRGDLRQGILNGHDLVFATTQLAKEGLDRKDLDTIIIALPFKSESQFRQILGRIQRELEGKKKPMAIIFQDDGIHTTRRMCQQLRKALKSFQYPFHIA
jgi:superfamily II DNA or RNA helicase